TEYFCPMCPGVISDWPGKCPVCNMALVRRQRGAAVALPDGVVARMQLSPDRVQLAGVHTSPVAYRPLLPELRTPGLVQPAERRLHALLAPAAGTVREVSVTPGATVAADAPLLVLHGTDAPETVRAPVAGCLTSLQARVGQQIAAGAALGEVADLTRVGV